MTVTDRSFSDIPFIDMHCHPPVPAFLDGPFAPYLPALERQFGRPVPRLTADEIGSMYRDLGGRAVVLGWDASTATGLPPFTTADVADVLAAAPDVFIGFGAVDPHRDDAVNAVTEAADSGMHGLKFHPSAQRFDPSDDRFHAMFSAAAERGLVCLFHTGYTALGAGLPGGAGIETRLADPLLLDALAARLPDLQIVAAHPSWPFQQNAIAAAMHKPSIWLELSGWSPRRIPPELLDAVCGPLSTRTLFGTDFPFITPEKWLRDWEQLDVDEAVTRSVLHDNAVRLLGL